VKHNLPLYCPTLFIALGNALLPGVFPDTKISQIFLSEKKLNQNLDYGYNGMIIPGH
jgi:hypothetical protein